MNPAKRKFISTELLKSNGIEFRSKLGGWTILIDTNFVEVIFTPSNGIFFYFGILFKGNGIFNLIKLCKKGK